MPFANELKYKGVARHASAENSQGNYGGTTSPQIMPVTRRLSVLSTAAAATSMVVELLEPRLSRQKRMHARLLDQAFLPCRAREAHP